MLTSLNFLGVGQDWPPKSETDRLKMYAENKKLFEGKHEEVFKDWVRLLREDQQATLTIILNWHKRLTTLWADLLVGEPPTITSGDPDSPEQITVDRLKDENKLHQALYKAIIDVSRFGTGIFKARYDRRGIIEVQPPDCWFPVINPTNIEDIQAHVLAWTWEETTRNVFGQEQTTKYMQCEIHTRGKIETRKYLLDGNTLSKALPLPPGVQEVVLTGVDDFLVIPFNNILTSDRITGIDDYTDIDGILQELEVRFSQISRILDKHSDPNMYGPESALEWDPDTHQYRYKAGGKYFPVDSKEDVVPGYIVWEGQLKAAFDEINALMEQLYFLTETSPAAFGQLKAGLAESGTALKRLMLSTLAKVNRIRLQVDPAVKQAIIIASHLETVMKYPKAVKIEEIHINWKDGLPEDAKEQVEIETQRYMAGLTSLESSIARLDNCSGDKLAEEVGRIREDQTPSIVKNPNISLEE